MFTILPSYKCSCKELNGTNFLSISIASHKKMTKKAQKNSSFLTFAYSNNVYFGRVGT